MLTVTLLSHYWRNRHNAHNTSQHNSWSGHGWGLRSSIIDSWLKQPLPLVSHSPPAGETWSGHSLRSGGASASLAIGVNMFYIMHHVVWKSMPAVQQYLFLHVFPSAAAYLFFGWMLMRDRPS